MPIVIKASGDRENFKEEKILQSIKYAGVPDSLQNNLLEYVKNNLKDQTSTSNIYNLITDFLSKSSYPYLKSKYSLKQAIMDFGPTGFPFEDFIAKIIAEKGFVTKTRVILQGTCVSHEVDVLAEKGGKKIIVEAKFHNYPGAKTDIHVVLYTKARFEDLKQRHNLSEVWLATNTKVSLDSAIYARCVKMNIIDWRNSDGGGLANLIEETGLYPITVLTSLSQNQKKVLLENHIVLCRDIYNNNNVLDILTLSDKEKETILNEAQFICQRVNL